MYTNQFQVLNGKMLNGLYFMPENIADEKEKINSKISNLSYKQRVYILSL